MSYVVSTASKSPFAKPKKHSQWESFPPVAQLLFPFDNSLYFVMVKNIQLACEQALWRALSCPPPPEPPEELAGFRIPLAESRVLSLAHRELVRKLKFSPSCFSSRRRKIWRTSRRECSLSLPFFSMGQQHRVQYGILMVILTFLLFFNALILQDTQRQWWMKTTKLVGKKRQEPSAEVWTKSKINRHIKEAHYT